MKIILQHHLNSNYMKKLSKLKLREFHEMSDFEMKNVVGGYYVARGTCSVYIPRTIGNAPSLGNYDSQTTTYSSGGLYVNSEAGFTIHRGVSYDSVMGMISGVSGAKWCCDNCGNASWL